MGSDGKIILLTEIHKKYQKYFKNILFLSLITDFHRIKDMSIPFSESVKVSPGTWESQNSPKRSARLSPIITIQI